MKKRMLCLLLTAVILLGTFPAAFAEEGYIHIEQFSQHETLIAGGTYSVSSSHIGSYPSDYPYTKSFLCLYRAELTGSETEAQLRAIALELIEARTDNVGFNSDNGHLSAKLWMEMHLPEEPGSFLIVAFNYYSQWQESAGMYVMVPDPNTLDVRAIHTEEGEIPLQRVYLNYMDENMKVLGSLDERTLELDSPSYVKIHYYPYNADNQAEDLVIIEKTGTFDITKTDEKNLYKITGGCGYAMFTVQLEKEPPQDFMYPIFTISLSCTAGNETVVTRPASAARPGRFTYLCQTCGEHTGGGDIPQIFSDVSRYSYYADALNYCYDYKLVSGLTKTTFGPSDTITRGQVVTLLYRLTGQPEPGIESPFKDVPEDSYYYDAIRWAAELGIAKGTSVDRFQPDAPVTREQLASFMYRYIHVLNIENHFSADLTGFTDHKKVSSYARESMSWAVGAGLISGTSSTTLSPQDPAQRAQFVAILYRAICQFHEIAPQDPE